MGTDEEVDADEAYVNRTLDPAPFEDLYERLKGLERELRQHASNMSSCTAQYNNEVERREVLKTVREAGSSNRNAGEAKIPQGESVVMTPLTGGELDDMRINVVAGVIKSSVVNQFRRQLFRSTRGNFHLEVKNIDPEVGLKDPDTQQPAEMSVFLVYYRAEQIRIKIGRVCDAFGAHRYEVPSFNDVDLISNQLLHSKDDIVRFDKLMSDTEGLQVDLLQNQVASHLRRWLAVAQRRKAIFHTITKFRVRRAAGGSSQLFSAEGWLQASSYETVKAGLNNLRSLNDNTPIIFNSVTAPAGATPPTAFETNRFTSVFQGMVDTYGIARYQEANPALFTVITFPFLFGVMYGDIGHGTCIFIAGLYMVLNEAKLSRGKLGDIGSMIFGGRYMILMMGIFAIYMGFIYNDIFSLTLPLFGTSWDFASPDDKNPNMSSVYPFGLDPSWHNAENSLPFQNSMKMKFSVILGVSQMIFGAFLKTSNAIYFRKPLDFIFECIPMITFAFGFFGYMLFLIFYKWSIDWNNSPSGMAGGYNPPALINQLINMALSPGAVKDPLYGRVVDPHISNYTGCGVDPTVTCCTENGCTQAIVQFYLLCAAGLSIPLILIPKPLILYFCVNKRPHHRESGSNVELMNQSEKYDEEDGLTLSDGDHDHDSHGGHEAHGLGDLVIHQTIETIEFVLGFISNTASYLRLWALSLAHAELAEVFWEKSMKSAINYNNFFFVFVAYAVFAAITIGVLLLMDVLECFLHALRLHWVEFQNKFYRADGYAFDAFRLRDIRGQASE